MSSYDVNSANTNRIVRFRVESATAGQAGLIFGMLKGRANMHPRYGALTTASTANQELAALRTSLVVRALSVYAPVVGVALCADSYSTGGATAIVAPAIMISFETEESGVFFNNAWASDTTQPRDLTADLPDSVGVGGMTTAKSKPGLASLLAALGGSGTNASTGANAVSYDNGTTSPFGFKSQSGAITLPDGSVTSGAPSLYNASNNTNTSGLQVVYVAA